MDDQKWISIKEQNKKHIYNQNRKQHRKPKVKPKKINEAPVDVQVSSKTWLKDLQAAWDKKHPIAYVPVDIPDEDPNYEPTFKVASGKRVINRDLSNYRRPLSDFELSQIIPVRVPNLNPYQKRSEMTHEEYEEWLIEGYMYGYGPIDIWSSHSESESYKSDSDDNDDNETEDESEIL